MAGSKPLCDGSVVIRAADVQVARIDRGVVPGVERDEVGRCTAEARLAGYNTSGRSPSTPPIANFGADQTPRAQPGCLSMIYFDIRSHTAIIATWHSSLSSLGVSK